MKLQIDNLTLIKLKTNRFRNCAILTGNRFLNNNLLSFLCYYFICSSELFKKIYTKKVN